MVSLTLSVQTTVTHPALPDGKALGLGTTRASTLQMLRLMASEQLAQGS